MNDLIAVTRDGAIATVVLNRPREIERADQGDVAGAGRGDRRAVGGRCAALRDRARRRREGVLAGQRHRRIRRRARQPGAGDRLWPGDARDGEAFLRCRHPLVAQIHGICVGGGLEIAALCDIRICGESSRFGVPIKNLGPGDGVSGNGAAGAPRRRRRRARDPARRAHLRRRRGEGQAPRHARRSRCRGRRGGAGRRRERIADGAPLVARWHKKFARRLAEGRPLADDEYDECFACFDTEDFRTGYAAFLAKTKPEFRGK